MEATTKGPTTDDVCRTKLVSRLDRNKTLRVEKASNEQDSKEDLRSVSTLDWIHFNCYESHSAQRQYFTLVRACYDMEDLSDRQLQMLSDYDLLYLTKQLERYHNIQT